MQQVLISGTLHQQLNSSKFLLFHGPDTLSRPNTCEGLDAVMESDCNDPGSVLERVPDCLALTCFAKCNKFQSLETLQIRTRCGLAKDIGIQFAFFDYTY